MKVYENQQDFATDIENKLQTKGLDKDTVKQLTESILQVDEEQRSNNGVVDGLNLKIGKRILRDSDLPILEGIGMVAAAITAVIVPAALVAPAIVSGIASFAKLVWSTWRNTAKLSESEIAVLGLLEVHGPLFTKDLISKATEIFPNMSLETLSLTLMSLTDVEQLNGDIIELVRKDASGRWRTRSNV